MKKHIYVENKNEVYKVLRIDFVDNEIHLDDGTVCDLDDVKFVVFKKEEEDAGSKILD